VLGSCIDLTALAGLAHRHGARLLVDAAQLVAHRKLDLAASDIDLLAFSAHKAYAPFGSGALVARRGSLRFGAEELERIRASGDENVAGIAGLGKALSLLSRIGFEVIEAEEHALTARALRGLARIPRLKVFGVKDPDSARFAQRTGVIAFLLEGVMAGVVARGLAERSGIGVRAGCHCAHQLIKHLLGVSPGLERFQRVLVTLLPRLSLPGVTRVSLGLENTEEDIDALLEALSALVQQPSGARASRGLLQDFAHATAERVYARSSPAPG
jgi:selenocysteine lyase/cysteine desulfurase